MQAINGHTVDPGAAAVCATILMPDDKTACLKGALDKRYSAEELSACRGILMGDDKARCMAAAGSLPPPPPPARAEERRRARRDDDDDDERPARARRRADDDEDDDRPRARRRDDDDDERPARNRDDVRTVRLTNYHRGTVARVYWRARSERKFHELSLPADVHTNQYEDLLLPDRTVAVCIETPDGFRLYWASVGTEYEALVIGADEPNWAQGRCRDVR